MGEPVWKQTGMQCGRCGRTGDGGGRLRRRRREPWKVPEEGCGLVWRQSPEGQLGGKGPWRDQLSSSPLSFESFLEVA